MYNEQTICMACKEKDCPRGLWMEKIAVAAVNYRLSGKNAQCPEYIYDAAAAAAWVRKHIAEYGGAPKKVYVSGLSTRRISLSDRHRETRRIRKDPVERKF